MALAGPVELTTDERAELRALVNGRDLPAVVAARADRVVGWRRKQVAELAEVSRPTVDLWLSRVVAEGWPGCAKVRLVQSGIKKLVDDNANQ